MYLGVPLDQHFDLGCRDVESTANHNVFAAAYEFVELCFVTGDLKGVACAVIAISVKSGIVEFRCVVIATKQVRALHTQLTLLADFCDFRPGVGINQTCLHPFADRE